MKRNSIGKNYGYNLIYNIVNIIVPFLTAPYINRVLGTENIGIYSFTYSIVSSMVMFGAMGTATYGQKEVATCGDDIIERSKVFWEIFVLKAITTLVMFFGFIPYAMAGDYLFYYLLEVPFFIAGIMDVAYLYQGVEQFQHIALRNIAVRILGIVLLFSLVKSKNDLWIYILIISITQMGGNLSMWAFLRDFVRPSKIEAVNVLKRIKPVMIYFIPSVTYQIYAVLDKAMLGWLVESNYENGIYEQAHKIINLVISVISAYTVVMRSRMSALYAKKDYEEIKIKMHDSYNVISFFSFPMTFGLAVIAEGMIPWFLGNKDNSVVYLLYFFCPIFIFMSYSRLIGTHILTPSGRQVKSNNAQIIAMFFNIFLNALLIPRFFAVGATIASVSAEVMIMLLYFIMVRKEIEFDVMIKCGWKKVLSAVAMFVILFPNRNLFEPSIVWSFTLVGCGATIYILMLLLLRDTFTKKCLDVVILKVKKKVKK